MAVPRRCCGRASYALDLYRRGLVSRIILTGGVGRGDRLSEAAAGKQYLIEQRLPAEVLLLDERSTTTRENLRNAAALARANGINSVLLVSDPFHMLRSLKMARDLGLAAYGSPTRTSPISVNWAEEARYIVRGPGPTWSIWWHGNEPVARISPGRAHRRAAR